MTWLAAYCGGHDAFSYRGPGQDGFTGRLRYSGGYSGVTDFIREWRSSEGKTPHAFVPLKFELGEAFQFDWSDESMVVGGIYYKMQVSHMKLCASRAFWLVAYPSQGHEMLFDAHTRSFAALGGVARRGIYDNMKTAVDKVKKGGSLGESVGSFWRFSIQRSCFSADQISRPPWTRHLRTGQACGQPLRGA